MRLQMICYVSLFAQFYFNSRLLLIVSAKEVSFNGSTILAHSQVLDGTFSHFFFHVTG